MNIHYLLRSSVRPKNTFRQCIYLLLISSTLLCYMSSPCHAQVSDMPTMFPDYLIVADKAISPLLDSPLLEPTYSYQEHFTWRPYTSVSQQYLFTRISLEKLMVQDFCSPEKETEKAPAISYALPTLSFTKVPESYRVHNGRTFEFGKPIVHSDCPEGYEITHEDITESGDSLGTSVHVRLWTITDACGNLSNCKQTIYVFSNDDWKTSPIQNMEEQTKDIPKI